MSRTENTPGLGHPGASSESASPVSGTANRSASYLSMKPSLSGTGLRAGQVKQLGIAVSLARKLGRGVNTLARGRMDQRHTAGRVHTSESISRRGPRGAMTYLKRLVLVKVCHNQSESQQ